MMIRNALAAVVGLTASALACSQGLPPPGHYVSADGSFVLTVVQTDANNGHIKGTYQSLSTPVGALEEKGNVADFAWVNNAQGQSGQPPFGIKFGGHWRPDPWNYLLRDQWNGAYRTDGTILAEGSRTYLVDDGTVQVQSLGTQVFTLKN